MLSFFIVTLVFGDFYDLEELPGKRSKPVLVDTVLQIQSINEINLNGEYMDATIALSMRWTDARLSWNSDDFGGYKKIRARKEQVWIPDLNIVNRIHDFSPEDEKTPKRKILIISTATSLHEFSVQIQNGGNVTFTRLYRMRAAFDPKIDQYPYDTQMPVLKIASTDYSAQKVNVRITEIYSVLYFSLDYN